MNSQWTETKRVGILRTRASFVPLIHTAESYKRLLHGREVVAKPQHKRFPERRLKVAGSVCHVAGSKVVKASTLEVVSWNLGRRVLYDARPRKKLDRRLPDRSGLLYHWWSIPLTHSSRRCASIACGVDFIAFDSSYSDGRGIPGQLPPLIGLFYREMATYLHTIQAFRDLGPPLRNLLVSSVTIPSAPLIGRVLPLNRLSAVFDGSFSCSSFLLRVDFE